MPKGQASDEGSKSRSFGPYPSLFDTQDGRRGASRAGPSSRTGPVTPRLPAPHQQSVAGVGPQLSSSYPSHLRLGDSSGPSYSNPSGSHWMQYPPPTYSNSSIHPTESTALFQRALTGSQPQPQSAPVVNAVHQPPPSENPKGERRNPAATNFGAIPSVYDVYAQVPPSCSPRAPVETYPVFNRLASTWPVQDPGAFSSSLPLSQALNAHPAPSSQRPAENPTQFGSSSMLEPSLSFLYNPYPHPLPFDPSGVMPNPPLTPSSSWEWMNQFLPYPNINTDPQPQLPTAPIIDILDILSKSSFEWTAKDLELLSNPSLLTSSYVPSALISSAQPYIPPQLPPQSSDKQSVRDPQHQWPHFGDHAQPGQVVEAPVSLADPSVDNIACSSRSFLQDAHHFRTGDWHFNNHKTTVVTSGKIDGWEILQKHTAPNALYNSSARYDAPKCDEDTRVEVIAEIMGWIKDRAHPQRVLCMTGAAGSGKSALQQSIAECCSEDNILGGAYFISAADTSRNTATTIVPTIAYQLGLNHPVLQSSVAAEVERDPLVFSRSLETQMNALVVCPFESLRRSRACDIATFPYAILIDGLDECQGELIDTNGAENTKTVVKRRLGEDRQAELLSALKNSLLKHDLPFRIFIASRPEWAIHTALGTGGSLHGLAYHIPLSDKYDATEDMRRYLRRRFEDICLRINQPHWFTEGNIDTLVQAGSGQFVYVATVYKYVSERRASPVQRLKTVLNWTPEQVTRPFEALDMLYRNILLSAKEAYEAVDTHSGRDFLLLLKIYLLNLRHTGPSGWIYGGEEIGSDAVTALLDLESDALEILTLDLRSLVYLKEDEPASRYLAAYHKSLYDFMDEKSRAKDLFVPVPSTVCNHLAKCCMQRIIESPELELYTPNLVHWSDCSASISKRCVSLAIYCLDNYFPEANVDDEIVDFTHKGRWEKIDAVLCKHSGFEIIFEEWEVAMYWAEHLVGATKVLKERRPEAGDIMSKYAEKWLHIAQEYYYGDGTTDSESSAGSNDESSHSDSD